MSSVILASIFCMHASCYCGCFFLSLLQVAVARMRSTQQVYALKIMNKWDLLRRGEVHTQTQSCSHIHRTKKHRKKGKKSQIVAYALWFKMGVLQLFVAQCDIHLAICLSVFYVCVSYRQHVTRRRGRFCWGVTDAGLQSCTMPFRMTTFW